MCACAMSARGCALVRALPTGPAGWSAEAPLRKPSSRSRVPLLSWDLDPLQADSFLPRENRNLPWDCCGVD